MKKLTLLLIPLLFVLGLNAKDISSNSTLHQYSKPGAPIDMSYKSQKVDINETSDVNITLTSAINKGNVFVVIRLDKNLSSLKEFDNNISFKILPNQQEFIINLQVKSEYQGLHYIRLLTKVNKGFGIKLRSFAVPVYIGEKAGVPNNNANVNSHMKALGSGENISISKAIETIQIIKKTRESLK